MSMWILWETSSYIETNVKIHGIFTSPDKAKEWFHKKYFPNASPKYCFFHSWELSNDKKSWRNTRSDIDDVVDRVYIKEFNVI